MDGEPGEQQRDLAGYRDARAIGQSDDVDPSVPSEALERLEREEVVSVHDGDIVASRCARHLDGLGLVSV